MEDSIEIKAEFKDGKYIISKEEFERIENLLMKQSIKINTFYEYGIEYWENYDNAIEEYNNIMG